MAVIELQCSLEKHDKRLLSQYVLGVGTSQNIPNIKHHLIYLISTSTAVGNPFAEFRNVFNSSYCLHGIRINGLVLWNEAMKP
jgi:hypothetical protein